MCYSALVKKDLDFLGQHYGASVIRQQISDFKALSAENPKLYPPLHSRIFPGHYAPIIFIENGIRVIKLMRYGAYPPPHIPNPAKYTTYNARRDNLLSSFWSDSFKKHHGFVVLMAMYEWVLVQDLLKAGVVTRDRVAEYFKKQAEGRKVKLLVQGKKYKPTPTELKQLESRRIIIEFKPSNDELLTVPVIFSAYQSTNSVDGWGFAIVTDHPPKEVEEAGHDRSPIILSQEALDTWLDPNHRSAENLTQCLSQTVPILFQHDLEKATG